MLKTLTEQKLNSLSQLYATISKDLEQVESCLASELTSQHEFVNELLTKSNRLSGKRLRPALLLLCAQACGTLSSEHIKLAAAIEMIHTATLVHDDILDSAEHRRHAKTLNCEYSNHVAILTGDFLFSHAFYLTSTLPTTFAAQEIGRATNQVCEGEIRQIGTKKRYQVSEAEYIEIIDSKTAVLCSCAAKLGAYYAGASTEQVAAAATYGTYLGIAFQIVDDLLDLLGDESDTGKSLGTDLQQHKPTLPIIHYLSGLSHTARDHFTDQLIREEIPLSEVRERLHESGSFDYAKRTAENYVSRAIEQVEDWAESPAKSVLAQLPAFVLVRSH